MSDTNRAMQYPNDVETILFDSGDPEITAMAKIAAALGELTERQRYSVLAWTVARYMPMALLEYVNTTEIPKSDEPAEP